MKEKKSNEYMRRKKEKNQMNIWDEIKRKKSNRTFEMNERDKVKWTLSSYNQTTVNTTYLCVLIRQNLSFTATVQTWNIYTFWSKQSHVLIWW